MPKKKSVDWTAVQADRDAGIPVADLVKKYSVSNPTIYTRTKGSTTKQTVPKSRNIGRILGSGDGLEANYRAILAKIDEQISELQVAHKVLVAFLETHTK